MCTRSVDKRATLPIIFPFPITCYGDASTGHNTVRDLRAKLYAINGKISMRLFDFPEFVNKLFIFLLNQNFPNHKPATVDAVQWSRMHGHRQF